jgi:hypothetical protein
MPMAFKAELCRLAERNGWKPGPIATVMLLESGMNSAAVNPKGGATGLIQFIPSTAKLLGTTTEALRSMSAIRQLEYVEKFFKMVGLPAGARAGDYYIATFMPNFIGKPDSAVMSVAGENIYDVNKGLDRNSDGVITVGDVRSYLENTLSQAESKPPIPVDLSVSKNTDSLWPWLLAGSAAWFFRKHLGFGK